MRCLFSRSTSSELMGIASILAVPPFRLLKGSKSQDILGEKWQVSQRYFSSFPQNDGDVYAVLVSNNLVPTVVSLVGSFGGMGFFLYRDCLAFEGSSGPGRPEA